MKHMMLVVLYCLTLMPGWSQLTTTSYGGNKKATTGERIGLTDVVIRYDRPGVKGREGKIWGTLVHEGYKDQGFGTSKQAPWRAGANESTTISFSNDVKIEGKDLPAGTYGLFVAYKPDASTVIFSRDNSSWGSYFYDEKDDALRVNVRPVSTDKSVEWLKYEFVDQTDSTATVLLQWEKLAIPFRVQANVVKDQLTSFRKELKSEKGFNWMAFNQAAQWCLQRKVNIDEALQWADVASGPMFGGDKEFQPHATKAQLLSLAGRNDEAATVMKNALPYADMQELHQYGRQLLASQKNKEALEVFRMNAAKHPNQFTTLLGLARGYAANGDSKSALRSAQQALPLAPDEANKTNVNTIIERLKQGKPIE